MKIYAISTLTSDWLCEEIFLPSIRRSEPSAEVTVKKYDLTDNENFASPGYVRTLLYRLANILEWIEENMGSLILISDVDIMYIRPFVLAMEHEAMGYDITGQRQCNDTNSLNFGQTLIRCSRATLTLFRNVYDECVSNNALDQDALNRQLSASSLRYKTLSPLFANTSVGYFPDMYSYHTINSFPTPGKNSMQHKMEQFAELQRYLISQQILMAVSFDAEMTDSSVLTATNILNLLVAKHAYRSYLHIGFGGEVGDSINVDPSRKVFVDPVSAGATHVISSDVFFQINNKTYDLIFINGLRYSYQVYRDIVNALEVLNPGGTIVCHDINPVKVEEHDSLRGQDNWMGNAWRAWVRLRMERSNLNMVVVDANHGCGIIQPGEQALVPHVDHLTWDKLVENRIEWLNLISEAEFIERFGGISVQSKRS